MRGRGLGIAIAIVIIVAGAVAAAIWSRGRSAGSRASEAGEATDLGAPAVAEIPPIPAALGGADPQIGATLARLRDAVAADRASAAKWLELARAFHAAEAIEEAVACYRQVLRASPSEARAWFHLAAALDRIGQDDEAAAAYRSSARCAPDYAPAHWRRGLLEIERGRLDEAEQAFRAALAVDARDASARTGLGRVMLESGRIAEGVALLDPVAQSEAPLRDYARFLLADTLRRQGRAEDARALLAATGDTAPRWRDSWSDELAAHRAGFRGRLDQARALLDAGRLDHAIALLEPLRAAQPENVTLLTTLGMAQRRRGRLDDAVAILDEAIAFDEGFFDAHVQIAVALLERGRRRGGAEGDRDLADAVRHADRAIALNPTHAPAHGLRGDLHLVAGATESAATCYAEAARCDAMDPRWPLRAGIALLAAERPADALPILRGAALLAPNDPEAHRAVAVAAARAGAIDEADAALRRAEALGGDAGAIAATREEIDRARAAGGAR